MNLAEIPLLGLLRERMSWLNARQGVLSQNIANADSPGYVARDLKPLDFESVLKNSERGSANTLTVTDPRHIAINSGGSFADTESADTQANPTGNSVSLEEEMIKVADTQAQYQAAANLYSKAIGLLRTAIGHS
ncbi:MAG TPA: flagellar basal body rod protein FlgB [Rhizomicrobium sp.]|nr:flagellar basal body rod protein FlgB [Rhizomicrobium sp.]